MTKMMKSRQPRILNTKRLSKTPLAIIIMRNLEKTLPGEIGKLHRRYKQLAESTDVKKVEDFKKIGRVLKRYRAIEREIKEIISKK